MKVYMALNETGTHGDIGLHARMAVATLRRNTNLDPVLLYFGERNAATRWFEQQGVRIVDSRPPYIDLIYRLTAAGRYWTSSIGHWLRTNVALEETTDAYVLYTDVDTVFLRASDYGAFAPRYFSAAPEFKTDAWNYVNAGVMIINVDRFRKDYEAFEDYLVRNIEEKTYGFHDQIAYNIFYRNRWERLPLAMNWKPYWGFNGEAEILHFHGPKVGAIEALLSGTWDWQSDHGKQIGSLFVSYLPAYEKYIALVLHSLDGLDPPDRDRLERLLPAIARFDAARYRPYIDLSFMAHKMFPD